MPKIFKYWSLRSHDVDISSAYFGASMLLQSTYIYILLYIYVFIFSLSEYITNIHKNLGGQNVHLAKMGQQVFGQNVPWPFWECEKQNREMPRATKKIYSFNKGCKMSNGWLIARPLSGNCSQIATLFSPIWIAATLTAIFLVLAIVLELFFSSLWPFSERIRRTLPKAQQTQESSARVIAQTSQELVKVLHTMAKL